MHKGVQGWCCGVRGCVLDTNRKPYAQRSARALFHGIVMWCESYGFSKINDNLIQFFNS